MTRAHLITCLRVVLCAVLLGAVGTCVACGAWLWALVPVALMMPVFGSTVVCINCTGTPHNQVQIDWTLLTDGSCTSCSSYNATYIATYDAVNSARSVWCTYTYDISSPACSTMPKVGFSYSGGSAAQTTIGDDYAGNLLFFHGVRGNLTRTTFTCDEVMGPNTGTDIAHVNNVCLGGSVTVTPI